MSNVLYQASCVALNVHGGWQAILIEGPPGCGKSSLALALIDRGARLIGDDGVSLESENGRLLAAPPPNIRGKLEIRNVGIVDLPVLDRAPIALCLRLDKAAPRHVDEASRMDILGIAVPLLTLWPDSPAIALRAEWALRLYGNA